MDDGQFPGFLVDSPTACWETKPAYPASAWDEPLTSLPGVDEKTAEKLAKALGGASVRDLLFSLPHDFIDRRARRHVANLVEGEIATLKVLCTAVSPPRRRGLPGIVRLKDDTGSVELHFFSSAPLKRFLVGEVYIVSGKATVFRGKIEMQEPLLTVPFRDAVRFPYIEAVRSLPRGLSAGLMASIIEAALARTSGAEEWLAPETLQTNRWEGFSQCLSALHFPSEVPSPALRRRLVYDELFTRQVYMAQQVHEITSREGHSLRGDGSLCRAALAKFGHQPTPAQRKVLGEIFADMRSNRPMYRLLQGDVGSGKTLVAVLSMLTAVEAGAQAAIMAPTELLARQHHAFLSRISSEPVLFLSGSSTPAEKRVVLGHLAAGRVNLVAGTHALLSPNVRFKNLGLAIIDEEQRFGVAHKEILGSKAPGLDMLLMTATPIPRSLVLSRYGAMTVSRIEARPEGRLPIKTSMHKLTEMESIYGAIERMIANEGRVYWVCPLISDSSAIDVAAAEERYRVLEARFGNKVALVHGGQSSDQRRAGLKRFESGECGILVSTTVIEVGVDVPAATVMVIEHADRFGVSQLHQLRGRVGRGHKQSYCLLLHPPKLSGTSERRLRLLRDTNDGFLIADEDHKIRGGGDALGTKQSGVPDFRMANPEADYDLLRAANREAKLLVQQDPTLASPRGRAARRALQIFGLPPVGLPS